MARNKFDTDEELDPEFNPHIVKRLLKYLVPYKKRMFVAGLFMIIASFTSLLGPFLIKTAIDVAIPNKDMKLLVLLSSLILMGIVVVWLFLTLRFKIMSKLAQDIIVTIRTDVFSKIQALPFTYFDSRPHGKILIRVVNYV
ncbi:MAG TPA: ABC transporter transmembrane domain-containing protein, partial [Treponemataceae bacterium]|nr:ABC transporter transmembrane domain-containing protein [Treponemataceae bacterium]